MELIETTTTTTTTTSITASNETFKLNSADVKFYLFDKCYKEI